jgi:hypothetical protein
VPLVEIIEPDLFVVNVAKPEETHAVAHFVYEVGDIVGETPYVAAFSVDGRAASGSVLERLRDKAPVRIGREDAVRLKRFDGGKEVVVWLPPDEDWTCDLLSQHWDHHEHMCWGLFVDGRALQDVAQDLHATWPRRHAHGDHSKLLESTVGPDRKLLPTSEITDVVCPTLALTHSPIVPVMPPQGATSPTPRACSSWGRGSTSPSLAASCSRTPSAMG